MTTLKQAVKAIRILYLTRGIDAALSEYLRYIKFPIAPFQLEDMRMSVKYGEVAWIRTRRGGKSRDLTIIAVFLALLEYLVIWRAPFSDQLKQASLYFAHNPFVKKIAIASRNEVDIAFSPSIDIGSLTIGKTASLGCDALIYDEGGKVEKDKIMYQNYLYSRAMIAASPRQKFIIHGTTPAIYTAIEETVQSLPAECVSTHPYTDCNWIPDNFIDDEEKKHIDDPWYIDQEYRCMFVVRGGSVFDKIATYKELGIALPSTYTHVGVDFNGTVGHMIVRISFDDNYIYCQPDMVVHDVNDIAKYSTGKYCEIEDGGFNAGYVKHSTFHYVKRSVDDAWQSERLAECRKRTIVVNEHANYGLRKNLREAMYDERKPLVKKRNDQHYLDALFHAMAPITPKTTTKRIKTNLDYNFGQSFGVI